MEYNDYLCYFRHLDLESNFQQNLVPQVLYNDQLVFKFA